MVILCCLPTNKKPFPNSVKKCSSLFIMAVSRSDSVYFSFSSSPKKGELTGRQQRITIEDEHFYVDLVFYNRLLQCFVLIDLKIGKLKHQDLGQMQMYVNYYDEFKKTKEENLTIGIVLCKQKNETLVRITLPKENQQIFASKYQTVLPSKEELKQLIENKE